MRARLTACFSYANVASTLALFLALSTGVAYAADEWTGENIVNGSLTGVDLAPDSIGTNKIKDETVSEMDLAIDSVGSSELIPDSVHAVHISNNTIDSGEIVDGSVFAVDLAPNSVGASEIASDSVGPLDIVAGAVGPQEIATNGVGSNDIAPNAVGNSELANFAVGSAEIATSAVNLGHIKGANFSGSISVAAGAVANGRCIHINRTIPVAEATEAVLLSLRASAPVGMLFTAIRAPSEDTVTVSVCNLTGGASPECRTSGRRAGDAS